MLVGTTLYGTTFEGGTCTGKSGGCGTVFSLDLANDNVLTTLYDFPDAGLAGPFIAGVDADGNIYGITQGGGANGLGTIFALELVGGSYQYELLHSFAVTDGPPRVAPLLTSASHLYGVTVGGERNGSEIGGVLYDYSIADGTLKTLHVFPNDAQPNSIPYIDAAGTIYGTTMLGGNFSCGSAGCGTVFEYTR